MKQYSLFLSTLSLLAILLASACEDTELFDVVCPRFDTELFVYFPPGTGDTLVFRDSTGTQIRKFGVTDRYVFADTTYESLQEGELCSPFAEYLLREANEERTVINFFINQLSNPVGGVALSVNFSDIDAVGAPYFQSVRVRPQINSGSLNTEATAIDSLRIDGFLYEDVVLAELISTVPGANTYVNDVRRIWLAPEGGIIRFEDQRTGVWELQRPQ